MSETKEMKKIDLDTLDKAGGKISAGRAKTALIAAVILVAVAVGGYGAYGLFAGGVVASRFTVNKMNCPGCVTTVQEAAGKIGGVIETDVSLASGAVTVKYRSKLADPAQIGQAIVKAGYPTVHDGVFTPDGRGADNNVAALVNGRPVLLKDLELAKGPGTDPASAFFNLVGAEVLLQAADRRAVVVQPDEVAAAAQSFGAEQGLPAEKVAERVNSRFGSPEKFHQQLARAVAIRKLIDDHAVQGVSDPKEKERKTLEWVGVVFKDADVKVVDPEVAKKLLASAGQDDWKKFWPQMIGRDTELKTMLLR
jgi:copper chaperone CopZ